MTTHTPGPWRLSREGNAFDGYWNILAPDQTSRGKFGPQVATVLGALGHDSTSEANARLIAAAPDLLAALAEVARDYEYMCDPDDMESEGARLLTKMLAALQSARGEG